MSLSLSPVSVSSRVKRMHQITDVPAVRIHVPGVHIAHRRCMIHLVYVQASVLVSATVSATVFYTWPCTSEISDISQIYSRITSGAVVLCTAASVSIVIVLCSLLCLCVCALLCVCVSVRERGNDLSYCCMLLRANKMSIDSSSTNDTQTCARATRSMFS
jgi:hypothetical protein